jgi:hypothetical protein
VKLHTLLENSWVLGNAKVSIPRSGFWKDNAPVAYRDRKLTDPRIPKAIIIKVAQKHPNGIYGMKNAIQSLINMGSAKGASMVRLRRILKWLSDEAKRGGLSEMVDSQIRKQAYIAKSAPSTHEIGWLGHKRFSGDKKSVQIKFDPSDPDIKDNYIFHTHPYDDDASALRAMPSHTDLQTAIDSAEYGLMGMVVFCGPYYSVVVPTTKAKDITTNSYEDAINRGDIEDAIKEIERIGFDIETGKL